MEIKFRDQADQAWWDKLSAYKKDLVTKAYKCYDEMAGTPLLDNMPDTVVTTIRNYYPLYQKLKHAHHKFEREQVLNEALRIVGADWMNFNELFPHGAPCQHLRGWLEVRGKDDLVARCARAVDLEFERMQKEGA